MANTALQLIKLIIITNYEKLAEKLTEKKYLSQQKMYWKINQKIYLLFEISIVSLVVIAIIKGTKFG